MKKLLFILLAVTPTLAFSKSADYHCEAGRYIVDLTLTQDRSTSMSFKENHHVLAVGYAGVVERKGDNTIYHFFPRLGLIDITIKTQDTIDFPEQLVGEIRVEAPVFLLRDNLDCFKR